MGAGQLQIGTSGYSYSDWVGPVYPEGTQSRDFLEHYATLFRFTEINFTYYRQPAHGQLDSIAKRAGSDFLFSVKAHKSLTHERSDGWKQEADRFMAALPNVYGVLLQFPFSFHYNNENRRYLASLSDALSGQRLFVEFRNSEWDQESVFREMERRELALVVPDLPRLDGLPAISPRLTAPHGYIRFHGRNSASWWNGTNITRYDYRYTTAELQSWVEPVLDLAAQAETIAIAFNNHFQGQAVTNAQELAALLGVAAA
jgi:uncharacterized protein YecE (DUF72 family)